MLLTTTFYTLFSEVLKMKRGIYLMKVTQLRMTFIRQRGVIPCLKLVTLGLMQASYTAEYALAIGHHLILD